MIASLALVAGACGGSDDEAASDSSSSSASEAAVDTETGSEPESDSSEESDDAMEESDDDSMEESDDAAMDEPDDEGGNTVTVTDAVGEATVPVTDQGIYALDELMATILLTLDVQPVTTAAFFQDPLLAPVLISDRTELVEFGSIESIAATDPDLVLGIGHPNFIEIYDELNGVAPTVLPDFTDTWQAQTRTVAQIVDRVDEAEALIATVEGRIDALAAEIDEAGLAGQQAAILQDFGGSWFAYGPTTISGSVLASLGFTRSEIQSGEGDFGFIPVAEELVPDESNVEWVFGIATTSPDGGPAGGSIIDNPLVGGADSVVTDVGEAWFNNSVLGAWIVLDDIEAIVFGRGDVTQLDGAGAAFEALLAATSGETAEADAGEDVGDDTGDGDGGETAGGNVLDAATAAGASTIPGLAGFAPTFASVTQGEGPVTFFVPSEEAFTTFGTEFPDLTAALTADFDALDAALQYPVVDGALLAADVTALSELTAIDGNTITIEVTDDGVTLNGGQARIIETDITASNGVVHIIDRIILPPEIAATAS